MNNPKNVCRAATWPERNTDQKLEALRTQLLYLTWVIEDWSNRLGKLEVHQHSASGQVLSPIGGPAVALPPSTITSMVFSIGVILLDKF